MTEKHVENRDTKEEINAMENNIKRTNYMGWVYAALIILILGAVLAGSYWDWW